MIMTEKITINAIDFLVEYNRSDSEIEITGLELINGRQALDWLDTRIDEERIIDAILDIHPFGGDDDQFEE